MIWPMGFAGGFIDEAYDDEELSGGMTGSVIADAFAGVVHEGCLLGVRAVVPAMEDAGGGSVVDIGSAVAFSGTLAGEPDSPAGP